MDQLYGKKIGVKHPPKVKAEMLKDTFAAWILFFIGFGVINHIDDLFRQELAEVQDVVDSKLSRDIV